MSAHSTNTGYFAEHRCIPCGNGSWDELPTTAVYMTPICCGKPTVPTGRIQRDGYLLSIVPLLMRRPEAELPHQFSE